MTPHPVMSSQIYRRFLNLKSDLVAWSLKYDAFRQQLLQSPKSTLEQELGEALPEDLLVHVLEDHHNFRWLVIPHSSGWDQEPSPHPPITDLEIGMLLMTGEDSPEEALETRLLERLKQESALSRQLCDDPRALLEKLSICLPDGVSPALKLVEDAPCEIHLAIPLPLDDLSGQDLSEDQLLGLTGAMVGGSLGANTITDNMAFTSCCVCA